MGEADLGIIRALARVTGASLCFVTPVFGGDAAGSAPGDEVFKTALVVWHMDGLKDLAGRNELRVVGAVSLGVRLQGEELRESLESGNDGLVARLEGGYLDAGQGTGGMLNLTGSALTVSVRLRRIASAFVDTGRTRTGNPGAISGSCLMRSDGLSQASRCSTKCLAACAMRSATGLPM